MLKTTIHFFALLITFSSYAQLDPSASFRDVRKIEVTGSAEMDIIPDEIYYTISLQEYKADNKKTELETLEKQLVKAVAEAGIAKENLQIEDAQSYRQQIDKKKKNEDFMASKQYVLKLNNLYKINQVLGGVDSKGVAYTDIRRYSHTKIESLRKEIKIKAVQAAREKATYLVESIGEKLGDVLQIQEVGDYYPMPYQEMRASNMMMKDAVVEEAPQIDFKEIKIRYEVRAVFKID